MATLREVADRVSSLEEAATVRRDASERGETAVLTNGCFDLLHSGHLHFLESASSLGDHLWIALNGDASIRALKGPSRPLQTQLERAYALLSLKFVSGIFVFETERLAREIRFFKPDIYAKAGDYCLDTINAEEKEALEEVDAEIRFLPFLEGYGTTTLLEKIKSLPET